MLRGGGTIHEFEGCRSLRVHLFGWFKGEQKDTSHIQGSLTLRNLQLFGVAGPEEFPGGWGGRPASSPIRSGKTSDSRGVAWRVPAVRFLGLFWVVWWLVSKLNPPKVKLLAGDHKTDSPGRSFIWGSKS